MLAGRIDGIPPNYSLVRNFIMLHRATHIPLLYWRLVQCQQWVQCQEPIPGLNGFYSIFSDKTENQTIDNYGHIYHSSQNWEKLINYPWHLPTWHLAELGKKTCLTAILAILAWPEISKKIWTKLSLRPDRALPKKKSSPGLSLAKNDKIKLHALTLIIIFYTAA